MRLKLRCHDFSFDANTLSCYPRRQPQHHASKAGSRGTAKAPPASILSSDRGRWIRPCHHMFAPKNSCGTSHNYLTAPKYVPSQNIPLRTFADWVTLKALCGDTTALLRYLRQRGKVLDHSHTPKTPCETTLSNVSLTSPRSSTRCRPQPPIGERDARPSECPNGPTSA